MLEPFLKRRTPNKMDAGAMSAVRAIGVAADHSLTQNLTQRRQELANTEAALRQQMEILALSAPELKSLRHAVSILVQQRIRLESQLRSTRRHLLAGRPDMALAELQGAILGSDSEDEEEEEDQEDDTEMEQEDDSPPPLTRH